MGKVDAIKIFGTQAELARALGFTRSAISQWGDQLTQKQADLVIGAALRLGRIRAGDLTSRTKDKAA